jgi:hypothetical protein
LKASVTEEELWEQRAGATVPGEERTNATAFNRVAIAALRRPSAKDR